MKAPQAEKERHKIAIARLLQAEIEDEEKHRGQMRTSIEQGTQPD